MEYLASPYTHEELHIMERRFHLVTVAAAQLINQGRIIYSPIMHFHPIAVRHELPRNFAYWEVVNRAILSRCDKLLVLTIEGWQESEGVQAEIAHAAELNIPCEYVSISQWLR